MDRLWFILCVLSVCVGVRSASSSISGKACGTCYYEGDTQQFSYVAGSVDTDKGTAWGCYSDDIETTGWSTLSVSTHPAPQPASSGGDVGAMFCAGVVEAALTHSRMHDYFVNYFVSNFGPLGTPIPQNITDFVRDQWQWMVDMVSALPEDDYWVQVGLVLAQIEGMQKGFARECTGEECSDDIYLLVLAGDLEDIVIWSELSTSAMDRYRSRNQRILAGQQLGENEPNPKFLSALLRTACSALVRITDDDLFAGHSLWTGYSNMLRVFKFYDFPLMQKSTVARMSSFASKPADITSKDDYYVLSSGFVVLETSLTVFNDSQIRTLSPKTVPSYIREVVSNRMASSSEHWTEVFKREHSGTHNAQWIVADTRNYVPGKPLPSGVLWVLEEIPTTIEAHDETDRLQSNGYYAGYNIPSFKTISALSGTDELVKEFGPYFSYENCPRSKIFARDAVQVSSFTDFQDLMQSNEYQTDPLSENSPVNAICSRYDLISEDPFQLPPIAYGCADSKATSLNRLRSMETVAVSGPGHLDQPVFSYTGPFASVPHRGQPERWDFDWVSMTPLVCE